MTSTLLPIYVIGNQRLSGVESAVTLESAIEQEQSKLHSSDAEDSAD